MWDNSYLNYYLSLFKGIRDTINYLIYDEVNLKNITGIEDNDLKKFSFMVMMCSSDEEKYRWVLLKDQKDYVIKQLEINQNLIKLINKNETVENFYETWINFYLCESGFVRYFTQTDKDNDYIKNFRNEKYLIAKGYEEDYNNQEEFKNLRQTYRNKNNINSQFDPFVELESIWGFSDVSFYYIKLPKLENLKFIGIFPIICEEEKHFFENADYIFSLVKNAVLGANLMKNIMDENTKLLRKSLLKTAIISILVDSFAHNIAAHSLQQILKWLNERIQYSNQKFIYSLENCEELNEAISKDKVNDFTKLNVNENELNISSILWNGDTNCINQLIKNIEEIRNKNNELSEISKQYLPLSFDVFRYNLLKYINNKATFWSGVIKDSVLGGTITNWFDILYEFCYNPYFIGTIAGSENIFRVNFCIHCNECNSETVKENCDKSDFMTINLKNIINRKSNGNGSKIIEGGEKFEDLRKKLENKLVFLPGGDVGKHSLYTIFENVLRNVKHCDKTVNGVYQIKFNIRINEIKNKLYKIDLWLSNKSSLYKDDEKEKIKTSTSLNNNIARSIIDENFNPRMGGIYQDKICACQLLTNDFINVEKEYYLGKKPLKFINYYEINEDENYNQCCLVSSFYVWKGDKYNKKEVNFKGEPDEGGLLLKREGIKDEIIENIRRFKLYVAKDATQKRKVESFGVVRVIVNENKEANEESFERYYDIWLDEWLGSDNETIIKIKTSNEPVAYIMRDEKNKWKISSENNVQGNISLKEIDFTHSDDRNGQLLFRSHGYIKNFFDISNQNLVFKKDKMSELRAKEFIETILTSVYIVDNRINNLIKSYINETQADEILWEQMKIKSLPEGDNKTDAQENLKKLKCDINSLEKVHFLILHYSYIENFFDKSVVKFVEENLKNSHNEFIFKKLIITTGRGRDKWFREIKNNKENDKLISKVMFFPPESLTSAISYGTRIRDDFELKYRLIKLLMN